MKSKADVSRYTYWVFSPPGSVSTSFELDILGQLEYVSRCFELNQLFVQTQIWELLLSDRMDMDRSIYTWIFRWQLWRSSFILCPISCFYVGWGLGIKSIIRSSHEILLVDLKSSYCHLFGVKSSPYIETPLLRIGSSTCKNETLALNASFFECWPSITQSLFIHYASILEVHAHQIAIQDVSK